MKHLFLYGAVLLAASSCGPDKTQEPEVPQVPVEEVKVEPATPEVSGDMYAYQNMEIVQYCTLIPKEYEEDQEASEKAGHLFIHKFKKGNEIEIKGLLRANTEVGLEEYMKGSLEDAQLEGKVIQQKEMFKEGSCFYTKGYWNNSINESRFLEICWLRRDDVVKYYAFFNVADTTAWDGYLRELLAFGSVCK